MSSPPTMMIKVHWEGEDFPLQIPVSATIMQLKFEISQQLGRTIAIPTGRQELSLHNGMSLSDETSTVEDCGICQGTVLTLLQKIGLTIEIDGDRSLPLVVSEHITVGGLKHHIQQYGVDTQNKVLRMTYQGQWVVLDDRSYLWAAGIGEGTHLFISF